MFVITADQRRSRTDHDRVDEAISTVDQTLSSRQLRATRKFQRTAGDEIQALFDDPATVLEVTMSLIGTGHWRVGIGAGSVDKPVPRDVRAGRGAAFIHAREAVTIAHRQRRHLAVVGPDPAAAQDAHTAMTALVTVIDSRSEYGRQAVELMRAGQTQSEVAGTLSISTQAVSQRLQAAEWELEQQLRTLSTRLLAAADRATTSS